MSLSVKRIEKFIREAEEKRAAYKQQGRSYKGRRYRDGRGLYLQIRSAENCSWVLRYKFQEQPRVMGLGSFELVDLDAARTKAFEAPAILFTSVPQPQP